MVWTVVGLGRALGTGEWTAVEVASMLLDRLERLTPVTGATGTLPGDPDRRPTRDATAAARCIEHARPNGPFGCERVGRV